MENAAPAPAPGPRWIRIAVFYLIALAGSYLVRFHGVQTNPASPSTSALGLYWHLAGGLGPFLAAAAVALLFRYRSSMSLGGTDPWLGLLMIVTPATVMAVLGIANPFGVEPHLFGAHMGVWIALYAILEETGWRGYLQDEFKPLPRLLKYIVVGVFWYGWHLSWLGKTNLANEAAGLAVLIAASIGIGFVADRTGSVLAAASFHVIGNIMGLTTDFRTLVPSSEARLTIVIACSVIWLVVLRIWRVRDNRRARTALA